MRRCSCVWSGHHVLAHVGLKVFVFTIPGFVGYFWISRVAGDSAYAVVALEFFGGLALILGIYAPFGRVAFSLGDARDDRVCAWRQRVAVH